MPGLFLQSTGKNFLKLGYGTILSVTKLDNTYQSFITKKKDICSYPTNDLRKFINSTIKQLRSLSKLLKNILNVVRTLLKFTSFIKKLLIGLNILVRLLKLFPLPARWTIVGMGVSMGDILSKVTLQLKSALVIVLGIDFLVRYISNFLGNVIRRIDDLISRLRLVIDKLRDCAKNLENLANVVPINPNLLDSFNLGLDLGDLNLGGGVTGGIGGTGGGLGERNDDALRRRLLEEAALRRRLAEELEASLGALNALLELLRSQLGELINNPNNYKGFSFSIIEEQTVDQVIAKRRYAIAVNTLGILALQGNPSFATDTQILIDELKLRIDIEGLTGYTPEQLATINNPNNIGNTSGNTNNNILGPDGNPLNVGGLENNKSSNLQNIDNEGNIIEEDDTNITKVNNGNNINVADRELDEALSGIITLDAPLNMKDLEQQIAEEFGLENMEEIDIEARESENDIEELTNTDSGESKLKRKYRRRQKRFVRNLEKKASKGNAKARELVSKINNKQISIDEARGEWAAYRRDVLTKLLGN